MPDKRSRWYHLLAAGDTTLRQGDILPRFQYQCPTAYEWPLPQIKIAEPGLTIAEQDVVVLTPCCDLDQTNNKKKVDFVLLCPLWDFEKAAGVPEISGVRPNHKNDIEKGAMPRYCFLAASDLPECPMALQIADFNRVFPILRDVVDDHIRQGSPRLRMNPPYREYLARSFANCYTRIGLPMPPTKVAVRL